MEEAPKYLGSPIAGISSYKLRVGCITSTTTHDWERAKELAEGYMAYDPYVDIEIIGVGWLSDARYFDQINIYAQHESKKAEPDLTCGTGLHEALEQCFEADPQ